MTKRARAIAMSFMLLAVGAVASCDTNPYDRTQVPVVSVTQDAAAMVIRWTPDGAQLVRVYRGPTAGDGYGDRLVWSIAASGKNSLRSGVAYGTSPSGGATDVPAQPLVPLATYTIEVTRQDPKGKGDGFTNTGNRYVGTFPFVYLEVFPAATLTARPSAAAAVPRAAGTR